MKEEKLVSIITIVYNASKTLEQTILSVINQTYKNIEYIVVDGGSTDGSLDIIKKYEDKIAKWISEPDNGISDAFSKGVNMATGDLVGIINADDWFELDAVETIINNYDEDFDVFCGSMSMIKEDGSVDKIRSSRYEWLYLGMYIMHPTTFLKKEVYDAVGVFDDRYKYAMDYDLMLRIDKAGFKFLCIDHKIACMRVGGVSCDLEAANAEVFKLMKMNYPYTTYIKARIFTFLNNIRMSLINISR